MRALRYAAPALICGLGVTGIAMGAAQGPTTKPTAASFSTTAQHVTTKTCTGSDGNYAVINGTYSGTINGSLTEGTTDALTIKARSIVNQTTGDGTTFGHFSIKNGKSHVADGTLSAVDSGSGSLNGMLLGHIPGPPQPPHPSQGIVANFTGTLGASSLAGQIGGNGAMTNSGVVQSGSCSPPPPQHHDHHHPHPPGPPAEPPKHH